MKIGLAVLPKLPFDQLLPLATFAEEAGFSSLFVPDERFFRDPFVCLSAIAGVTRTIMLGTGVTDPFIRHPLLTAMAMASLQDLSNGRAILGLGAGISGFAQLRIERDAPATAIKRSILASRAFWAGEAVTASLGAYEAEAAALNFETGPVPIYVAGRGPKILEFGGQLAEGVLIGHFTSPEGLAWCEDHIARGLASREAALGAPDIALWAYTALHPGDRRAALDAVKPSIGRTLKSTPEVLGIFGMDTPEIRTGLAEIAYGRGPEFDATMRALVPDAMVPHLSLAGAPEDLVAQIQALEERGIGHVVILPYPPAGRDIAAMVHDFAEHVLPHVS